MKLIHNRKSNNVFSYNSKSELTSALLGSDNFAYDFDEIGNRETASEAGTATNYSANELNQYSAVGDFVPAYDADGNATLVKTATGTWTIAYNGENRPVRFENAGTQMVVEMNYDAQGRRFEKKITVAGTVTLHQCYIYRGFLQIACLDLTRAGTPALWFVFWDPTQPTGTRPLAIQKDGTWFIYGHDLTKNVCEVFGPAGYIRTEYSYSPFGNVTAVGDLEQPFQWSSEFYDSELDLVYYNYRHYIPALGRWLSRDPIEEQGGLNLYCFLKNDFFKTDYLGLKYIERLCRELIQKIERLSNSLKKEIDKYDPIKDGKGGFIHAHGITKPGGHYEEIKNLQNGLKNKLKKWKDVCKDDGDPPCSPFPYPKFADQLANKYIIEPQYPIESNDGTIWIAILSGATASIVAVVIAGNAGPQALVPEEIITVPIAAIVGGIIGATEFID